MNILSIGTDRKLFVDGSAVRERTAEYGRLFDELHIIVFAKRSLHLEPFLIAPNIWVYPTNSSSRFLYMRDARRIAKHIAAERKYTQANTVITVQDPFETGKVGLYLKKTLGLSLQVQIHTDLYSSYFKKGALLNRLRLYWAQKILPQADEIRVVSKRIKESLLKRGIAPDKIDVLPIYTAVPVSQAQSDAPSKYPQFNFRILMVGRLTQEKNIAFALAVFKDLLKKYPKAGLIIVGEGPEKQTLMYLAQKLNIASSVVFEPWQQDLSSFYNSSEIFLHTSLYEGYGLVLIEAGLAGMPIVTSDVGIADEILKDGINALIYPVNDKNSCLRKIMRILENNHIRHQFKMRLSEDLPKVLLRDKEQYVKHYSQLLEKAHKQYHQ
ncbi:glycosyltransferase [Candidatus Parcubacteria bacterium]|nr:glycosyltransferase [Candidatus Parcubacteria bacterium]